MTEQSVLDTLRRVPDRIILAVMGRELDMWSNNSCLCGWFVREKLAEIENCGASETSVPMKDGWDEVDSGKECARQFGGTDYDWNEIWLGVTDRADDDDPEFFGRFPTIERAFVQRVDEACFPKRSRKAS